MMHKREEWRLVVDETLSTVTKQMCEAAIVITSRHDADLASKHGW